MQYGNQTSAIVSSSLSAVSIDITIAEIRESETIFFIESLNKNEKQSEVQLKYKKLDRASIFRTLLSG